ncbi:MAG: Rrf2 family transcriptional regulator [Acidobacteriia bacterium]|nr:Rrf2 family transcriptional regulator [Terriglobia bacterium]
MQLTRAADYAIRVMIHLAAFAPGTRASRAELAAASECPEQFLSKVLQSLTRAGLVISHRGNTGGFELSPAHRGATMLEIVEAVEGPIRLNVCLGADDDCARQPWCAAYQIWSDAQDALTGVLRKANIAELAEVESQNRANARLEPMPSR